MAVRAVRLLRASRILRNARRVAVEDQGPDLRPGASTAVTIMLEVLERCFASRLATAAWQEQLKRLFPSWGGDVLSSRSRNTAVLGL